MTQREPKVLTDAWLDSIEAQAHLGFNTAEAAESTLINVIQYFREARAERDLYQTLFYEAQESLCSCNIVDVSKPIGDPYNYVCEWHEMHQRHVVAREPLLTLAAELDQLKAERDRLQGDLTMAAERTAFAQKCLDSELDRSRIRDDELHTLRELAGRVCDLCCEIDVNSPIEVGKLGRAVTELRAHLGEAPKPKEDGND